MAPLSAQLFADNSILNLRDVALTQSDAPQTFREKLPRVILDEMYPFVGLLDANGMTLEINRAALEGAGIGLNDIQGRPFREALWWQVCSETREKQRELCGRAAGGEFIRCDIEIYGRSAGEETIVIDFSLMPVRGQLGRIVFLLAGGRNITEKKAAEAELARKNDAEKLRILLNLLSNAFKFTPRGGRIRCTLAVRNEGFVLAVQDSGPVILGDRVELQQVLINLLINGMEAMTTTMSGPRALTVRSQLATTGEVVVAHWWIGTQVPHRFPIILLSSD